MLAGAEGGGGVDAQADAARRHAALVMRAMDEIAPGDERRKARLVLGQPVALGHALDRDVRRRRAQRRPGQRQRRLDQRRLAASRWRSPRPARRRRARPRTRSPRGHAAPSAAAAASAPAVSPRHDRYAPHTAALVMLQDQTRLAVRRMTSPLTPPSPTPGGRGGHRAPFIPSPLAGEGGTRREALGG